MDIKIPFLTLYTFSKDNWKRPKKEVNGLIQLLYRTLKKEFENFHKNPSLKNNNEKSTGFLSKKFSAIGAIVEGKDFGLPLEWETYDKKEKIKIIFTVKSIKTETLIESYYIIE